MIPRFELTPEDEGRRWRIAWIDKVDVCLDTAVREHVSKECFPRLKGVTPQLVAQVEQSVLTFLFQAHKEERLIKRNADLGQKENLVWWSLRGATESMPMMVVKSAPMTPEGLAKFEKLLARQLGKTGPRNFKTVIIRRNVIENFRRYYKSARADGQAGPVYSFWNAARLTWRTFWGNSDIPTYYPPTNSGLTDALHDLVPFVRHVHISDDPSTIGFVAVYVRLAWWTLGLVNARTIQCVNEVFRMVLPQGIHGQIKYVGIWRKKS